MERPRRRAASRSLTAKRTVDPAYYLGYVDDEESPQAIMAKFAAVDRIVARARRKAAAAEAASPRPSTPTLVEIESEHGPEYEVEPVSASDCAGTEASSASPELDSRTLARLLHATASASVKQARAQIDAVDVALFEQGIVESDMYWIDEEEADPLSESDDDAFNQLDQESFFADTPKAADAAAGAKTAGKAKARGGKTSKTATTATASRKRSRKAADAAVASASTTATVKAPKAKKTKRDTADASVARARKPAEDTGSTAPARKSKGSRSKTARAVAAAAAETPSVSDARAAPRSAKARQSRKAREQVELALANADAGRFLFLKRGVTPLDRVSDEPECTRIPPQPIPRSWCRSIAPFRPELPCAAALPGALHHVVPRVLDVPLASLGPVFEGVYIDPPWLDASAPQAWGVLPSDLARLKLGRDVMPKGLLFIWVRKTDIYDVVQVMKTLEFVYVENLAWVMLGVNNLLLQRHSALFNCSKMTLLIFKRVGVKTDTESDIVPIKHQRSADCVQGFVAYEPGHLRRTLKPRAVFDTIETMMYQSGYDEVQGRGRFLHLWGTAADVRSGWTTVEEAEPGAVIAEAQRGICTPTPATPPPVIPTVCAEPASLPHPSAL